MRQPQSADAPPDAKGQLPAPIFIGGARGLESSLLFCCDVSPLLFSCSLSASFGDPGRGGGVWLEPSAGSSVDWPD